MGESILSDRLNTMWKWKEAKGNQVKIPEQR